MPRRVAKRRGRPALRPDPRPRRAALVGLGTVSRAADRRISQAMKTELRITAPRTASSPIRLRVGDSIGMNGDRYPSPTDGNASHPDRVAAAAPLGAARRQMGRRRHGGIGGRTAGISRSSAPRIRCAPRAGSCAQAASNARSAPPPGSVRASAAIGASRSSARAVTRRCRHPRRPAPAGADAAQAACAAACQPRSAFSSRRLGAAFGRSGARQGSRKSAGGQGTPSRCLELAGSRRSPDRVTTLIQAKAWRAVPCTRAHGHGSGRG